MLNQLIPTYQETMGQEIVLPQVAPRYQGQPLPTKKIKNLKSFFPIGFLYWTQFFFAFFLVHEINRLPSFIDRP